MRRVPRAPPPPPPRASADTLEAAALADGQPSAAQVESVQQLDLPSHSAAGLGPGGVATSEGVAAAPLLAPVSAAQPSLPASSAPLASLAGPSLMVSSGGLGAAEREDGAALRSLPCSSVEGDLYI